MACIQLDAHIQQIRVFRARAMVAAGFALLLIGLLIARLAFLQVTAHEHFATRSDDNRLRLVAMPPTRGAIYDRHGVVLAENRPTYGLMITPELIDDMAGTLQRVGNLIKLRPGDLRRFNRLRRRQPSFERIPLRFQLSDDEVARFAVNRHHFPGVEIEARLSRFYPTGPEMAHVIGYVGRIDERDLQNIDAANYSGTSHIGKVGVEAFMEDQLHGIVGHRRIEINAAGREVNVIERTPPTPGKTLYLTIDSRLQRVAYDALGDYNGAVVAIDVRNGEVLAMVSTPGYDPNLFVNGISIKDYAALRDSREQPLFNRALRGQYPPGSTIKPFLGLASLEMGLNTTERTIFAGPYFSLPGDNHRYRDWKKTGHGWVDLDKSIVQSCDVYFYDLAVKMGIDRIHQSMSAFGFGQRTGLDMGGELGGLFPSRDWKRRRHGMAWYPGETVITGIGQGYILTTPVQLAAATATLANRGAGFVPRLLRQVENPLDGSLAAVSPKTRAPIDIANDANWDSIIRSMTRVVHASNGTAKQIAEDLAFPIAGKTGTAQVFTIRQDSEYDEDAIADHLRDHALFVSFAPSDQPVLAVAVIVENGGHGGKVAAPIARKVFDYHFTVQPPATRSPTTLAQRS